MCMVGIKPNQVSTYLTNRKSPERNEAQGIFYWKTVTSTGHCKMCPYLTSADKGRQSLFVKADRKYCQNRQRFQVHALT